MWRIVALCWVFTAPALAGALVIAVLATPQLAAEAGLWIPIAALLGALYGVPAARCIARFVEAPAAPQPPRCAGAGACGAAGRPWSALRDGRPALEVRRTRRASAPPPRDVDPRLRSPLLDRKTA